MHRFNGRSIEPGRTHSLISVANPDEDLRIFEKILATLAIHPRDKCPLPLLDATTVILVLVLISWSSDTQITAEILNLPNFLVPQFVPCAISHLKRVFSDTKSFAIMSAARGSLIQFLQGRVSIGFISGIPSINENPPRRSSPPTTTNHMASRLLTKVSIAAAACARRFTRVLLRARRRLRRGSQLVPAGCGGGVQQQEQQGALWRRAILMGRRCEPLDFPGAIHYDSFGRRVESPRCGSRKASGGALFCRSSDAVDDAVVTAAKRASQAY